MEWEGEGSWRREKSGNWDWHVKFKKRQFFFKKKNGFTKEQKAIDRFIIDPSRGDSLNM